MGCHSGNALGASMAIGTMPFYSRRQRVSMRPPEPRLNPPTSPPVRAMPTIEVSWGELVDKITILEIKEQRLATPAAVANVRNELAALTRVFGTLSPVPAGLDALKRDLKALN